MDKAKELLKKNNIKTVFVDFFDTVVHRDIHPDTVKQLWSLELAKKYDGLNARELYLTRLASENYLYGKKIEFDYHQLSNEIVKRLRNGENFVCDEDAFEKSLFDIETEIELQHVYRDDEMTAFLEECHLQGYKIFVVSDFYMQADFLHKILESIGCDKYIDRIFVSCDYGCSKAEGQLYEKVLNELDIVANHVLMIGDNHRVDYCNAKSHGLNAIWKKYRDNSVKINLQSINNRLNKLEKDKINSLFDYNAFKLYFFTEGLYQKIKEQRISNVFFLAREGQYLKKLFDIYREKKCDDDIHTHYLYVSRKATYEATLKDIEEEDFSVIFKQNGKVSISCASLLDNLNFSNSEKDEISRKLSSDDFDVEYDDLRSQEVFKKLVTLDTFKRIYEKHRIASRKLINDYIKEFGVDFNKEPLCLVDVGWKGTIQDNLYKALEDDIKVQGYYIGLEELTETDLNNKKTGVLYSRVPFESKYCAQWSRNRLVYEDVLQADHPSTKCYVLSEDGVVPVFDEKEHEALYTEAKRIQERIYSIFNDIADIFKDTVFCARNLEAEFLNIISHEVIRCTMDDLRAWKTMNDAHMNNFISLKSVQKTRENYSKRDKFLKVKAWLRNYKKVLNGEYFIKFASHMYSKKLYVLIPIHKHVVCFYFRRTRNNKSAGSQ